MSSYDGPRRRLRLILDLEADDYETLARALDGVSWQLASDKRETREITSGGYTSGFHLTLTCDPDMTGDRYRAALAEWSRANRADRLSRHTTSQHFTETTTEETP